MTSFARSGNEMNAFCMDSKLTDEIVFNPIQKMLTEIKLKNGMPNIEIEDLAVVDTWFNVYNERHYQGVHRHDGHPIDIDGKRFDPCFTVVYILNNPNNRNNTVFELDGLPFRPKLVTDIFDTSKYDSISEGTVIITSNMLPHFVKPSENDGRVTLAYNVYAKFCN
jgi:hypothetical protein